MSESNRHRSLSGLAAAAVLVLFAACTLCVLLSGAGIYRRLADAGEAGYAQRTCAQYISARIRQCPSGAALAVETFGGSTALVLREDVDGQRYVTRVYCREGWLMELFSAQGDDLSPDDGEKLLPARELDLQLEGGLLTARVVDDHGRVSTLAFTLRGEGGRP